MAEPGKVRRVERIAVNYGDYNYSNPQTSVVVRRNRTAEETYDQMRRINRNYGSSFSDARARSAYVRTMRALRRTGR